MPGGQSQMGTWGVPGQRGGEEHGQIGRPCRDLQVACRVLPPVAVGRLQGVPLLARHIFSYVTLWLVSRSMPRPNVCEFGDGLPPEAPHRKPLSLAELHKGSSVACSCSIGTAPPCRLAGHLLPAVNTWRRLRRSSCQVRSPWIAGAGNVLMTYRSGAGGQPRKGRVVSRRISAKV